MNIAKIAALGLRFTSIGSLWASRALADERVDLQEGLDLLAQVSGLVGEATDNDRLRLAIALSSTVLTWGAAASKDGKITAPEARRLLKRLERTLQAHGQDMTVDLGRVKRPRKAQTRRSTGQKRRKSAQKVAA